MGPERALPARGLGPFASRLSLLLGLLVAGVVAARFLDLGLSGLVPGVGGWELTKEFFSRALSPALSHEASWVPEGTRPILLTALLAAGRTVLFAAASLALSLPLGLLLGFLSSRRAWDFRDTHPIFAWSLGRVPDLARTFASLIRSIHELLWALLFLAALGISPAAGVFAIALPYAGTFSKIFSEMLDETDPGPGEALRAGGAGRLQVFFFGYLPPALPNLTAYTFYRFECALRSSAVLGFFGYPTLGFHISASFENLHYGEVWTFLYMLIALVTLADAWSAAMRRRFAK